MAIVEATSREVLVALYVRDALGIVDPSGLPRLLGTGLPPVEPPDARITWAWMRWWVSIVEPGARFPGPPDDALDGWEAAMRRHLDSARNYAEIAHDARPAAGPVPESASDLRVEVLPLAEWGIWWIGEDAVAVDEGLRSDPAAFSDALRRMRH